MFRVSVNFFISDQVYENGIQTYAWNSRQDSFYFVTATNAVKVQFTTDSSATFQGFNATFRGMT